MSRQLEQQLEQKQDRLNKAVLEAANGGLEAAVSRAGGVLLGFSFRFSEYECLLTLRADFPGGRQVGFVGSSSLAECLRKAVNEAKSDRVQWREDRWAKDKS